MLINVGPFCPPPTIKSLATALVGPEVVGCWRNNKNKCLNKENKLYNFCKFCSKD